MSNILIRRYNGPAIRSRRAKSLERCLGNATAKVRIVVSETGLATLPDILNAAFDLRSGGNYQGVASSQRIPSNHERNWAADLGHET